MAPEASLEAPVRRAFRDLALLGFGCAGLGLAMAFAFGRQISSSIQALAAAGVGVPRREFAGLGRTPLREVNEVARSLDAASHELRSSEARLRESETRLKEALYQGRAFVFDADIATDMITVTGGGAEIAGYSGTGPARISGAAIRARIHRDDYANFVGPLKQLTPAAPVLDTRFRLVDTKGENVWIGIRATAVFDDGGAILRLSGLAIDITARVRAEEAQSRLAAIVETSRDMIISVEPGGKIQTWNAGARRIFGYTAEEMVGQSLRMLVPDDVADFDRTVETMERTGSIQTETVRLAKDGRRIDVMISASSIAMPDGTRGSAAIFTDITERKRFEEQQRTLINELNHRVKNSLATIQSIAAHTFRDERHRGALATFVARLIALSEAHNVLTASNWEGASLAEVVERTVAPHQTGDGARFLCAGPSVWLDPRGALALALALHELCTNAAKYGALSNPTGTVAIQWAIELDAAEGTQLSMRWVESGGPPVVPPVSPGFGTHLVRGVLSEDLNARVDMQYEPDGFLCAFVAKMGRSGRGAEAAGR